MTIRSLFGAIALVMAIGACTRSEDNFDPGKMTEPPALGEVIGTDAASRAKAEEVYFRCTKVPRPERRGNPWCRLRDQISECRHGNCK